MAVLMAPNEVYEEDDWQVTGEVPGDEGLLYGPAREMFEQKVKTAEGLRPEDHEIATRIGGQIVAIDDLVLSSNHGRRDYAVRFPRGLGEHKKEAAITLSVAGLLAVAHHVHVRRKK